MLGKELFLKAMSDSKTSKKKNITKNEIEPEWKNWDYNLEVTISSTDSSSDYNINENFKSPMYEILPMKGYDEKDFGTLKILKDHPYGDEYKKEIENARFMSKKKCFIYKKLNESQRKDIQIYAQNNKMKYETYGELNNKFIAIWGSL